MGYVAQENLNSAPEDNFLHMTPGCKLPPEPSPIAICESQELRPPDEFVEFDLAASGREIVLQIRSYVRDEFRFFMYGVTRSTLYIITAASQRFRRCTM